MQTTCAGLSLAQPQTTIAIDARHTTVVVRRGKATDGVSELPIGAHGIAEEYFRHDPPRPVELEAAIDAVEDQVMTVARSLLAGSTLVVTGSFTDEIRHALAADTAREMVSLDEVEQLFQRLASESLGNPAARQGLPSGNGFVATALILRELMHHLSFTSVAFRADIERASESFSQAAADPDPTG